MTASTQTTETDEIFLVESWRCLILTQAGIENRIAMDLAKGKADLHQIVKVKRQGCPDMILYEIFRDL